MDNPNALPQAVSPREEALATRAMSMADKAGAFMEAAAQQGRTDLVQGFEKNMERLQLQMDDQANPQGMPDPAEKMNKAGKTASIIGMITGVASAAGGYLLAHKKGEGWKWGKKTAVATGSGIFGMIAGSIIAGQVIGKKARDDIDGSINAGQDQQLTAAENFISGAERLVQEYSGQLLARPQAGIPQQTPSSTTPDSPAALATALQTPEAIMGSAMDDARAAAMIQQQTAAMPAQSMPAQVIDEQQPVSGFSTGMTPREHGNFAQTIQTQRAATPEGHQL